ncbi:MAG TPA: hypothetical protein VLE03_09015 [Nitrospiraceae bacterium]|nr:hypothetical protein [Nitrospiraceae bacterium]
MGGRRTVVRLLIAWLFLFLPFVGFAKPPAASETVIPIYPVTSGISRSPTAPLSRVLILGTQDNPSLATAKAAAREVFQRGGITIAEESSSLPSRGIVGPQRRDRQESDASLLALGKKAGADHVLILEITDTLVLDKQAQMENSFLHDERVSVRVVGVESGVVVLEGTARWSQPVERAGDYIRELTVYAIGRALCAPDKWVEASEWNNGRGRCRR